MRLLSLFILGDLSSIFDKGLENARKSEKSVHLNADHLLDQANKVEFYGTFTAHEAKNQNLRFVA